jgi:hypothetical protein
MTHIKQGADLYRNADVGGREEREQQVNDAFGMKKWFAESVEWDGKL